MRGFRSIIFEFFSLIFIWKYFFFNQASCFNKFECTRPKICIAWYLIYHCAFCICLKKGGNSPRWFRMLTFVGIATISCLWNTSVLPNPAMTVRWKGNVFLNFYILISGPMWGFCSIIFEFLFINFFSLLRIL